MEHTPILLQILDAISPIVTTILAPAVGWMIKVLIDIRNGQTRSDQKCEEYDRRHAAHDATEKDIYQRLNYQGERIAEIGAKLPAHR
jgi:hypothetical protein